MVNANGEGAMELESVEIVSSNEEKGEDPGKRLSKLTIQLSHSSEGSKKGLTEQMPALDTSGVPSLEASVASSSSSSFHESLPVSKIVKAHSKAQQAVDETQCPLDEGCMTDRVVRFFCPFETPCPSQTDFRPKSQRAFEDNFAFCNDSVVPQPNQDCSTGTWVCVPDKWEGSPDRTNFNKSKQNIQNRCSTLQADKRKSDYIKKIRTQWHSRDCPIPLRSSRSEAAPQQSPLHTPKLSAVPSAYYDSDPEVEPKTTPKFKKRRPQMLNLEASNNSDDTSDMPQCPQVPRHSSRKMHSFFDSPRSVVETPDLHNDDEVRAFIQVAAEQKYKLIWHQPPRGNGNGSKGQPAQPPPISVLGWFEYGSQLDNHIVFPKFVWRQSFRSGFKDVTRVPNFIQLLTIICVVTPATLDRSLYPYARLDRSCRIRTHEGQELVFEAPSKQARDMFVNRMKVLVARLASSVIVHDEAMLQEFFTATGTESYADLDDEMSVDCHDQENQAMLPQLTISVEDSS